MNTVERITEAYDRREQAGKRRLYSLANPAALFLHQQREKEIIRILNHSWGGEMATGRKVLDAGCGEGAVLRDFIRYGARPRDCSGVDLLSGRIETARDLAPHMSFVCANAEELRFDDGSFDLVLLFTMLSSVPDQDMRKRIAGECLRVLGPDGFILYYDFCFDNPKNPDVTGIKRSELASLFPGCTIELKRTTLAPPIARRLAPFSPVFCQLLEKAPFLCTHHLGKIAIA
jgi:ubiquinone/menaquinone biosynthesis C-methylase UbiE